MATNWGGPKQQQITKNNRFEKQQISKISHFRKQYISKNTRSQKTTNFKKLQISKNNKFCKIAHCLGMSNLSYHHFENLTISFQEGKERTVESASR